MIITIFNYFSRILLGGLKGFLPPFFWRLRLILKKASIVSVGKSFNFRKLLTIRANKGARIDIGDNVFFNQNCSINCHNKISIGNNVQFGEHVLIYDHDHAFNRQTGVIPGEYKVSPVCIDDNCWIGSNVTILRGTCIEAGSIIGAGVTVKGNVKSGSVIINKEFINLSK